MKKVLSALLLSLAVSGSCFAAGVAQSFVAEEKMADAVVSALTDNSVTYEKASKHFSSNLVKNFTADRFTNMKKQIQERIGTIKDISLVSLTRQYNLQNGFNNVHDLVYYGSAGKDRSVRIIVHFTEEKGQRRVSAFDVTPINTQQPQQQQRRPQPQQQQRSVQPQKQQQRTQQQTEPILNDPYNINQQQQQRTQPQQQQRIPTMR